MIWYDFLRTRDADRVRPTPRPQLKLFSERTCAWFSFWGRESRAEVLVWSIEGQDAGAFTGATQALYREQWVMKIRMCLTGFPLWPAVKRTFEIRPYFFPLEYPGVDEGTSALAYESGWRQGRSPLPRGPSVLRMGGRAEGFGATAVSVPIPPGGFWNLEGAPVFSHPTMTTPNKRKRSSMNTKHEYEDRSLAKFHKCKVRRAVALLLLLPVAAWAGGVVSSCTEASLRSAMAGGGDRHLCLRRHDHAVQHHHQ